MNPNFEFLKDFEAVEHQGSSAQVLEEVEEMSFSIISRIRRILGEEEPNDDDEVQHAEEEAVITSEDQPTEVAPCS